MIPSTTINRHVASYDNPGPTCYEVMHLWQKDETDNMAKMQSILQSGS